MLMLCGVVSFPATAGEKEVGASVTEKASQLELLKRFDSEFVEITPGQGTFPASFSMGSPDGPANERPVHVVTLKNSFWIARYEVPQNLYEAVMDRNPSAWKGPRNSVEMVTWQEAVQFCRETTKRMRAAKLMDDEVEIRLPCEGEWEYCCRAGTATAYSFGEQATAPGDSGNAASLLDPYAWHTGNAAGNDPPVGAKKPNAWGIYDMHGYLWEYVADSWHESYEGAPVGAVRWESERVQQPRVMRGGSWRDRHELLRSTTRWPIPDHAKSDAVGFRCVKVKVIRAGSQ